MNEQELNEQVRALIGGLLIDKMALELRVRVLEEELRKAREEKPPTLSNS